MSGLRGGVLRVAVLVAALTGATATVANQARAAQAGATTRGSLNFTAANSLVDADFGCNYDVGHLFGPVGQDNFLEETSSATFSGSVDCTTTLPRIQLVAHLYDRSPSFNGQLFDGTDIGLGPIFDRSNVAHADSSGAVGYGARSTDGARKAEPAVEMVLDAPVEGTWSGCATPPPGMRLLLCDGVNGPQLHVIIGTGKLGTGLTATCRDLNASVDPEQARLTVKIGGVPASTQLINKVDPIRTAVIAFKKDLCSRGSAAEARALADERGKSLWDTAVAAARAGTAAGDDRPLYWARLSMTAAFHQYRPSFTVTQANLESRVDQAARGITSDSFALGTSKKAYISGFDPFSLDANILTGNPSAASVLPLDGTVVGGAEVQAIVLPVRYKDFDEMLVDNTFVAHLGAGAGTQQATFLTTVSQGGSTNFELEFYNGRTRAPSPPEVTVPVPDNLNKTGGGGTYASPYTPTTYLPASVDYAFFTTTLPVDRMLVGPTVIDTTVHEKVPPGNVSTPRSSGYTAGSSAVNGSGGGFLSNEVAYRVTRLRDDRHSTVPAGHVHTPYLTPPSSVTDPAYDTRRNTIRTQYLAILQAGLAAPATPPITLTMNKTTYHVGEVPTYTVAAQPNFPLKWSSTRNGTSTGEVDTQFGTSTDATGRWSGTGPAWTSAQKGTWVKFVRVNGRVAIFAFTVTA